MASTLLCAIKHFDPRYGRNGEQTLPRSHRALQGWKRLAPSYARLRQSLVGLNVGTVLHTHFRAFALAIMIGFSGNLRPNELLSLQPADLVPPQACVDLWL